MTVFGYSDEAEEATVVKVIPPEEEDPDDPEVREGNSLLL